MDQKQHFTYGPFGKARNAVLAEEEATALSVWTVACLCGLLRLEHPSYENQKVCLYDVIIEGNSCGVHSSDQVLTMLAGALLEKQIVVVCSNLVGVKNKTGEVQSKIGNVILVDANKNHVRSPTLPQLPQNKELFKSLSPYHAKLVGESYLGRSQPVFECTDVQGFLAVLRSYLDSLCSNLRSHTITNVQSNDDKLGDTEKFVSPSFPSFLLFTVKEFSGGELYTWGSNENGCLGVGCTEAIYEPERVEGPFLKFSVFKVSCGWKHTAAVSGGKVFTWGWGGSHGTFSVDGHSPGGQLGHGDDIDYYEPMMVEFGKNVKALEVSCGFNHTGAILEYA
ncbi:hypothetical protein IFM89_021884 [Coptis chinensis]|uniref:Uncharacterized protein n=1 Tax=Coptis chinensis TaxID=261450 RepID=A0A835HG54_9MAGN|nr:hypothetical protein IFM89_021884 [Coptis chinensis]